jgi:branched-subunit amino acid ABC-type transport system permease component
MLVVTLLITLLVDRVLRKTLIGHVLRATLEDPEGAALLGFDTRFIVRGVFALAGLISALAGYLIAPITQASPYVADELGLFGFAALAIGGFGSFGGALAGGLVVGLMTGIGAGFIDPHLLRPLIFVLCVLVLLVRPGGVFGSKGLFGSAKLRDV